ncbi:F-box protein FBXO6 [Plasmodium brasilianum]|uniref:F-box protein FBXO6 n=1 Tax=Plasmodium brasilianum TaxID=5824 RepID=A0ACB9Y7U5_PLABR|nr:F-box protein FBXO6 [Plasmodium brasilianum]
MCKTEKCKKHHLDVEYTANNQTEVIAPTNNSIVMAHNYSNACFSKRKKNEYLLPVQSIIKKENIFKNCDIVCNILPFLTFSERWNNKLLNKSFYKSFNTKYAWTSLDFRFLDVDLFNFSFFKKYNKLFYNTVSLSLSVNGNKRVEVTINMIIKHFKNLKDLRLYFRKKNTNYIYEGVHPIVSNILNLQILQDGKSERGEQVKCGREKDVRERDDRERDDQERDDRERDDQERDDRERDDRERDDRERDDREKCKHESCKSNNRVPDKCSDRVHIRTDGDECEQKEYDEDTKARNYNNSAKGKRDKKEKVFCSYKEYHTNENKDLYNSLPNDFTNCDIHLNDLFLEKYYYYYYCKYKEDKDYMENSLLTEESLQKYLYNIEHIKIFKNRNLILSNTFNNLERLVLDVELKGDELLCFVGKLNNLKDIIISKLLYSNKLNKSQSITIFTCFIEKMKQNNIRLIQLGLYFRNEYKPIDYLNNKKFRKILNERKEYLYNINKEEGDELIYILQKNHLNSLYCLWSNDLFISFEMYEQIKKFNNLKVWILPGWRALSLAKQ